MEHEEHAHPDPIGALLAEYGLRTQALARAMGLTTKHLYHKRRERWSWRPEEVEAAAAFLSARGVPLEDMSPGHGPAAGLRALLEASGYPLLPAGYLRLGRGPDNPTARSRRDRNRRLREARMAHRTPAA